MMPLDLRFYLNLGALIAVLTGFWALHHHGYNQGKAEIQAVLDAHLALDAQLIEKAKNEKITTEQKQNERAEEARIEYNGLIDELTAAVSDINRMRAPPPMPRCPALPVATNPASGVPEAAADSDRAASELKIGYGAYPVLEFYQRAIADSIQCNALIELVKTTQQR